MKRWAWNLFCLFSLLVFSLSVTLWVRSYRMMDDVSWFKSWLEFSHVPPRMRAMSYTLASCRARIAFIRVFFEDAGGTSVEETWGHTVSEPMGDLTGWFPHEQITLNLHLAGFQVFSSGYGRPGVQMTRRCLVLPLWLFLPAAVPPFLWWRKWRKRGRRGFPVSVTSVDGAKKFTTELTEITETQRGNS